VNAIDEAGAGAIGSGMEPVLWSLLPLVPLGGLAGLLSGLLGIGGGLVFSPLLLWLGHGPHQALATSSLAITLTTLGGTWSHLRSRQLPLAPALAIGLGAGLASMVFSQLGRGWNGALLLALQSAMYAVLTVVIRPADALPQAPSACRQPLAGLAAVGRVAGLSSGLLGVGGGLVMVPLMVSLLRLPLRLAIRLSTLAVLESAGVAAPTFVADGRGLLPIALVLGSAAAVAARWSAARLNKVPDAVLIWLLRGLTAFLAVDSGWRAVRLWLS